jgi:hypothetical protein
MAYPVLGALACLTDHPFYRGIAFLAVAVPLKLAPILR